MPPAVERLKRRAQYLRVGASRRKAVTPGIVLQASQRPSGTDSPRVGITASRKVGNAVLRNLAKRRLRALADEIIGDRALVDHDYVLIARQAIHDRDFASLRKDLEKALLRLDLYRAPRDVETGDKRD